MMLLNDVPVLAAHHAPDAPAIFYEGAVRTYGQLHERVLRLGDALSSIAEWGDRVAILSENRPEYIECYYGVPGAGLVLNPINYRLSAREISYILGNSEPTVLMLEKAFLPLIEEIRASLPSLRHLFLFDGEAQGYSSYEALLASGQAQPLERRPDEDDVAWLMYTSGTTGHPKGAMLTHRSVLASATNAMISFDFAREEMVLFMFPQFHVTAHVFPIYNLRNYPVVLMRSFDAETYFATVERFRVTHHAVAPTMLAMLLDHPAIDRHDLSSLRQMIYGASAMPPEVLRRAFAKLPQVGFGTAFGMTETSGNVVYLSKADHVRALEEDMSLLLSSGQQMPFVRVRVIDDEGRDVPPGQPGEVAVRGEQVMKGYWRNEQATQESFVDGWFRTGDMGRWDEEGNLYIVDRKKDMILSGGENVYSREVEDLLYEHPAVAEAAVIGLPDDTWGEVVAAVIRTRHPIEAAEIDAFCREHIAGYKRPRRIFFTDALPRNSSGKVQKHFLRDAVGRGDLVD